MLTVQHLQIHGAREATGQSVLTLQTTIDRPLASSETDFLNVISWSGFSLDALMQSKNLNQY